MDNRGLAPNESIQLLELMTLKNLTLTKSVTMSPLVSDTELKGILQNEIKACQAHIKELQALTEKSALLKEGTLEY
jgi:similar to spore coat protein